MPKEAEEIKNFFMFYVLLKQDFKWWKYFNTLRWNNWSGETLEAEEKKNHKNRAEHPERVQN